MPTPIFMPRTASTALLFALLAGLAAFALAAFSPGLLNDGDTYWHIRAGEWMIAQGRRVEDCYYARYDAPLPWRSDRGDEFSERLLGRAIASLEVRRTAMDLALDDGFVVRIDEDPATRPIQEGNKKPRKFGWRDDLRRAVFLCPTDEIWI